MATATKFKSRTGDESRQSRFKNEIGHFYTKALFYETTLAEKQTVLYTLKDEPHEGYPSLYQLYLAEGDLTEYEFANKYLGGWKHWCQLAECAWFKPYLARWRDELFLRTQARALRKIQESAEKGSVASNKYLLEKGWMPKDKKGRPSKADIKQEADRLRDEFMDDYERVMPNATH